MTHHKRKPWRAKLLRSLFIWHRNLGLTAALFVTLLATTGLLLNHTHELSLDSRYIKSALILDWYGIKAPERMSTFTAGSTAVTEVGTQIYRNTALIPQASPPLRGAVDAYGMVIIGVKNQLLLLTPAGELIERLDSEEGVPAGIQALGLNVAGDLVVKTTHGLYRTDSNILEWHETPEAPVHWVAASQPSQELRAALQEAYRGTGLSVERILLDIHSGRILGERGVYFVDTVAVLFLMLAISGVWLWGRHHVTMREHRRKRQKQTRV